MRLDEIVSLSDVLKTSHFVQLMGKLDTNVSQGINTTRVKNQILQAWQSGKRSKLHFDNLLRKIDLSLNDLIDK